MSDKTPTTNSEEWRKTPSASGAVSHKNLIVLLLVTLVVYANTLRNGFVLDDEVAITTNSLVQKGISAIPRILTTPYHFGTYNSANDLYRPLSLVLFAIEHQVFGVTPLPYHLVNILLFCSCIIVLFRFLSAILKPSQSGIVCLSCLLFALHPIHTEVVANIKSCDELLCFLFSFLSLYQFYQYATNGTISKLIFGTLFYFLSLLSKETSITFIIIVPVIFSFYINSDKKRIIHICIMALVAALAYLALRYVILTSHNANNIAKILPEDNALALEGLSASTRIATAIFILGIYIKLLLIPYPLVCDYSLGSIPFTDFSNVWVLLTTAILLLLVIYAIVSLLKRKQNVLVLAILFFIISISLFSNIPFLIGTTMGERLLFLPSIAFCIALPAFVSRIPGLSGNTPDSKRNINIVFLVIGICYSVITVARNAEWADNYTLYTADIKKSPEAAKLNQWYAAELLKKVKESNDPGEKQRLRDEAAACLTKALSVAPDYTEANFLMGSICLDLRQYDLAESYENKVLAVNPSHYNALNSMAGIYFAKKDYEKSISLCKRSIEINPQYVKAYVNIGFCYIYLRHFDSAVHFFLKAEILQPDYPSINQYIAICYAQLGDKMNAGKYEQIEQRSNPSFKLDNIVISQ